MSVTIVFNSESTGLELTLPNPVSGDSLQICGLGKITQNARGESSPLQGGLKKATLVWSFDSIDQTTVDLLKTFINDSVGQLWEITDWRGSTLNCILTNEPTFVRRNATDYSFSLELEWLLLE